MSEILPEESRSIEQLLASAQSGDRESLGAALEHFRNYLTFLVQMQLDPRLNVKVDASDIVQETFTEAYESFPRFRGTTEASFLAWLRQILATTIAATYRYYVGTQRRDIRMECNVHARLDQSSTFWNRMVAETSTPSLKVSRKETESRLASAIRTLPDHYRQVLYLRNTEGLSFADIAVQMERSVDSVQKLWVRALAHLRDLVDPGA